MTDAFNQFQDFRRSFTTAVDIELSPSITTIARGLMIQFMLKSNDAVHLASAITAGASSFVTTDQDFLPVRGRLPIEVAFLH